MHKNSAYSGSVQKNKKQNSGFWKKKVKQGGEKFCYQSATSSLTATLL